MCEPSRGRVGDRLLRYVHMEPAPRPPLEPLAELPVEEPLDAGVPPREPPAAAAGAPAAPTSAGAVEPSEDADEADLNFTDPELFLAPDDPAGAAPAVSLAEAPKAPQAPLTLALEDPIIDELLTTPTLPAKPTIRNAPGATFTAARPVASAIPLSRGPSKPPADPAARARTRAGLEEPDAQGRRFRPGPAGRPAVRDRASPGRTSADHLPAHGSGLHCPEPDCRALSVGAAAAEGRNGFRALVP